jgi:hypothetical protein
LTYTRKKKSMNTEIKKKLVALEANVDEVLFRRMYEDEEQQGGMGVGRAVNIGVGAAALGAGAYGAKMGDQAIRRKYGIMPGVGRREANRRAGKDAMDAAKGYGSRAQDAVTGSEGYKAGAKAWQRSGGQGAGLFSRVRRVLGGATRAMTGGRFGFEEIEGRVNRLIELAEVRINEKGQRSDQNLRRSIPGFLVGGIAPGAASVGNAARYNAENEIYRKRDAAGHAAVGALASVPVGVAGTLASMKLRNPKAAVAASLAGMAGAIGTGYGVTRAMGERSLDKRKRDSLLARLQSGQQG